MLLMPKTRVEVFSPLIFLVGPIRGAEDWQNAAAEYILSREPSFAVASPRNGANEKTAKHVVTGSESFPRQRAWELHYIDIAARIGAVMAWLPEEKEHNCNKAYGAMTRVELGQVMTRYHYDCSTGCCFGTDGKFSEINTIAYDLSRFAPDKKIFDSLEKTCDEAIRIAKINAD